jgi:hypothetical protein
MGLHLYVSEVQRWGCRGQQLLEVPVAEIEKELSIKHPLHKKKLILALEAKGRAQDPMSLVPILPGTRDLGGGIFPTTFLYSVSSLNKFAEARRKMGPSVSRSLAR